MNNTVACIIARTNSTRLPKKVLRKINGEMLIEFLIKKIKKAKNIDSIYLCTSVDETDKILLEVAKSHGIKSYAGSREKVIDRMLMVGEIENADNLIRITGDNVFCDEIFIDKMIEMHIKYNADYTRVGYLPLGVTAEIYFRKSLENHLLNIDAAQTEYLGYYIFFKPNELKKLILKPPVKFQKQYFSLTVDTPDDLERTKFIMKNLENKNEVYLDEILMLNEKKPIPFLKIDKNLPIKLPYDKVISYKEYLTILKERFAEFIQVELSENFYEEYKNR